MFQSEAEPNRKWTRAHQAPSASTTNVWKGCHPTSGTLTARGTLASFGTAMRVLLQYFSSLHPTLPRVSCCILRCLKQIFAVEQLMLERFTLLRSKQLPCIQRKSLSPPDATVFEQLWVLTPICNILFGRVKRGVSGSLFSVITLLEKFERHVLSLTLAR